jgi:sarcosine oxidase
MIGSPEGELVIGSEYSARRHRLPYERLESDELGYRYPQFHIPEDMIAIRDYRAGILFPEACITAHLDAARKHDATLRFNEQVTGWESDGAGVHISTRNEKYWANRLLITAGAWASDLLPDLNLPLNVERQVLFWFEPATKSSQLTPQTCPIFVWEPEEGKHFYGFPDIGTGVKVSRMHHGEITTPAALRRKVDASDEEPVREFLRKYMPDANGKLKTFEVCMFTNTPDLDFIIDFHPQHSQVLIASPCSGHGFKMSSAIGEIAADLLTEGESQYDISLFAIRRFADQLINLS